MKSGPAVSTDTSCNTRCCVLLAPARPRYHWWTSTPKTPDSPMRAFRSVTGRLRGTSKAELMFFVSPIQSSKRTMSEIVVNQSSKDDLLRFYHSRRSLMLFKHANCQYSYTRQLIEAEAVQLSVRVPVKKRCKRRAMPCMPRQAVNCASICQVTHPSLAFKDT